MSTYLLKYPKPHITSLKYLFDPEGCVRPTLMENNITYKPIGPESN